MPAKLVLSLNASVLGEFTLDQERITIGRKPDNDIQIDNLAVSGQHAAIITILNDSFLEDLDSTNGTFVLSRSSRNPDLVRSPSWLRRQSARRTPQFIIPPKASRSVPGWGQRWWRRCFTMTE